MMTQPEHTPCGAGFAREGCRVAGVVVLYRPGEDVAENIASYAGQVDILFAVDNSGNDTAGTAERLRQFDNVVHIVNGENLGVAKALNVGAELALEHGCDFLLTMDQDSRATPGMIDKMLACLGSFKPGYIGIIAPFHATKPGEKPAGNDNCLEVAAVMTSGNLLNLKAYKEVGSFLDELFVDFVDIEYCLRLRSRGFGVIRANRAVLEHSVGTIMKFRILSKDIYLTSHSPLRKYYKTRNRFFVADRYKDVFPAFCRADRIRFWLELLRLLFFESEKREKLAMMRKGYADYRRCRLGRYDAGAGGGFP